MDSPTEVSNPTLFLCPTLAKPLISNDVPTYLVPQEGLEPPRPCEHLILSQTRLPVPPLGLCTSTARRIIVTEPEASTLRGRQPAIPMPARSRAASPTPSDARR